MNKDLLNRGTLCLKTWVKGVLEVNQGDIQRLWAATTTKSKKGHIFRVKYGVTTLLNPNDIDESNQITRNI